MADYARSIETDSGEKKFLSVVDETLTKSGIPADAKKVGDKFNEKFINEEIKNITSINAFKEFLISRMGDDCYCIYAVSGCSAVFGVDDLIMGTATMYYGNYVFDGISHWNNRRWHGRFTSYDDTWKIIEEYHELNSKLNDCVFKSGIDVNLATVEWKTSSAGMYYADAMSVADLGLPNSGKIMGLYVSGWSGLSADALITPYLQNEIIRIMSTKQIKQGSISITVTRMRDF